MKLAEALVLRKHLEAKVKQLEPLKLQGERGVFDVQTKRVNVSESFDELTIQTPKLALTDITSEYNKYSKTLRQLDTNIQRTNWEAELSGTLDLDGIEV